VSLARHLRLQQVRVVEVMRPNRRSAEGTARPISSMRPPLPAVLSGEANAIPKTHDGPVGALWTLKMLQRSVTKSRTEALNQLRALLRPPRTSCGPGGVS